MGRRGPPKTPVAVLKERGTFRNDRHSDEIDSELGPSLPDPPPHFSEREIQLWNDIGQRLAARGLMTDLDSQAFELMIGSYVGIQTAQDQLDPRNLILYVGDQGHPVANPLIGIIAKHVATLKWCLTQFGCTPSSRTGINPAKRVEKVVDPMLALLGTAPKPPPSAPKSRTKKVKK